MIKHQEAAEDRRVRGLEGQSCHRVPGGARQWSGGLTALGEAATWRQLLRLAQSCLPFSLSALWEGADVVKMVEGTRVIIIRQCDCVKRRTVIPEVLRSEKLSLLHAAHQGVTAMSSRARDLVF